MNIVKAINPERLPVERPDPENASLPCYSAEALFCNGKEIRIIHHGESYCLRITRGGKLLLTK